MDASSPTTLKNIVTGGVSPLLRFGVPRVGHDTELSQSTQMLVAIGLTGKHLYQGTVPAHVIARRRAANKAARVARRAGR